MKLQHKTYLLLGTLLLLTIISSCRKDFDFTVSSGDLLFSKDTVFLDTVFANIGSSTYTLKVYNQENEDVLIPQIALAKGLESNYRLNVDGLAGKQFTDIPLLARDSLFIFVETTAGVEATAEIEFLDTDAILFETPNTTRRVELVTLVKDAIFLYPETLDDGMQETLVLIGADMEETVEISGFVLEDDELVFTNEKPYVIYGYAAVPDGKTLTIQAGTRVHFHNNSGILVAPGGSLQINGELSADSEVLENEVIFEGDRLEPEFASVPGQWGTIWLTTGSMATMNHLTLKNASVGLLVDGSPEANATPNLSLRNSQLYNASITNLWGRTANIVAENSVFGNSGSVSLYCNLGGDYDFKHCTIANYWSSGFRNAPSLLIDNFENLADGGSIGGDLNNASFANCIIDGNREVEFVLNSDTVNTFQFNFQSCSIKFNDRNGDFTNNPLFDFDNNPNYQGTVLNPNTAFTNTAENLFSLQMESEVIGVGDPAISAQVPLDILGVERTENPDLGAFQFVLPDIQ